MFEFRKRLDSVDPLHQLEYLAIPYYTLLYSIIP